MIVSLLNKSVIGVRHWFRRTAFRKASLLSLIILSTCSRGDHRVTTSQETWTHPKSEILICIDPGHGGEDPGKTVPDEAIEEKKLNLTTAIMLKDHLQTLGYRVMMTRDDDTFVPLKTRAEMANRAGASYFVSIHYNAAPNPNAQGVEVHIFPIEGTESTERRALATNVLNEVLHHTQANSRGVKESNFAVLRHSDMPAILVEGGFLTNSQEKPRLMSPKYQNAVAWGIAMGIHKQVNES